MTGSHRLQAALGGTALLALGGFFAIMPAQAATNLLVNGGFETPTTTGFTSGAPSGYTSTNNDFGVVGVQNEANNGIMTGDPDGGTQDLYENLNTAGGVTRPTTVPVTQTLDGLPAGDTSNGNPTLTTNAVTLAMDTTYIYSGDLIGRNDGILLGDVTFNLLAGNTVLGSETFSDAQGNNVGMGMVDPFTITVNSADFAAELGQTLSINAVGTGNGGPDLQQVNIDNLSLTANASPAPEVPEAGSLSLMGLALSGLLLRARRKSRAA
jgi:hypothetical protein